MDNKKELNVLNGLTDEEKLFCELYSAGEAPYAGNPEKCYIEAFPKERKSRAGILALKLINREDIQDYLNELEELHYEEARYMKRFLSQNLKGILMECATAQFRDRNGTALSVAPLRSVAVNAAKTLMDLHGCREAQVSKLKINSDSDGGVTFNVIMPGASVSNKETEEEAE